MCGGEADFWPNHVLLAASTMKSGSNTEITPRRNMMSTNEGSSCCSSDKGKIWCWIYGLCQLLLLTCISMALWEIYWAITALAEK